MPIADNLMVYQLSLFIKSFFHLRGDQKDDQKARATDRICDRLQMRKSLNQIHYLLIKTLSK